MLKTKEEFLAAAERYRKQKQLSPDQEAAEQKVLSEEAMDFRRALETIAQATEAFMKRTRTSVSGLLRQEETLIVFPFHRKVPDPDSAAGNDGWLN